MIDHLNNMLRHLFMAQIDEITEEEQVGFQPPDEKWHKEVSHLQGNALNVYLIDLRENRKLRSNARTRQFGNGIVSETPAPRRVDCHYLISAWSPATVTREIEPTLDEQALLYKVTGVLMNNEPLIPRQAYRPEPLPPTFPKVIAEAELPSTILPVEGFPKLAEFWGGMGNGSRWKPTVYLVVTLPVVLQAVEAGPLVTTRITEYRHSGQAETAAMSIQIFGRVLDTTGESPVAVPAAWVRLESTTGAPPQTTETDERGCYSFGGLATGWYTLRARLPGFAEVERRVGVPSPNGSYDIEMSQPQ